MKVLLQVFVNQDINDSVQAAWIELTPALVDGILRLRSLLNMIAETPSLDVVRMTYKDSTPVYLGSCTDHEKLAQNDEGEDYYLIDEDGREFTLTEMDMDITVLRDDQSSPENFIVDTEDDYLHIEKDGIWWESRLNCCNDRVETVFLSWQDLEGFRSRMEVEGNAK